MEERISIPEILSVILRLIDNMKFTVRTEEAPDGEICAWIEEYPGVCGFGEDKESALKDMKICLQDTTEEYAKKLKSGERIPADIMMPFLKVIMNGDMKECLNGRTC